MSVVLVNGDGNPAVHASQDADLLGGIGGQETGILDINDKFAATIADANTVEISSGVCITKEGRRIQIDVGDVEEIVVPTGSQGTTKYYIIGFHLYTDGSGNQLAETFIDEVASPSATITEKMFKDGETEVYVSLYRITRNGLNLEGLTLILPEIGSLAGGGIIGNTDISGIADGTVTGAIAQINTDLPDIFQIKEVLHISSTTTTATDYTTEDMSDYDFFIITNGILGFSPLYLYMGSLTNLFSKAQLLNTANYTYGTNITFYGTSGAVGERNLVIKYVSSTTLNVSHNGSYAHEVYVYGIKCNVV